MTDTFNPYIYSIFPHLKQAVLNRMFNTSKKDKTELIIRTSSGSITMSVAESADVTLPTYTEFEMMLTIVAHAKELDIQKGMRELDPYDETYGLSILHFLSYPLVLSFNSKKELLRKLKGYKTSNKNLDLLDKTLSIFQHYRITFNNSLLLKYPENCSSEKSDYQRSEISKLYCNDTRKSITESCHTDATFKIISELETSVNINRIEFDPIFWHLFIDHTEGFDIETQLLMTTSNEVHLDPYADSNEVHLDPYADD